jgi:hypothetical protein
MRFCGLLLALVLAAAGCGGDEEPESAATTDGAAGTSCVPATSDIMAPLGGRAALANADVRLQNGQLVESTETPGIWFLSAELDGPGLEEDGDVATWATASQYGEEAIYSVDDLAAEYTNFSPVAAADGISADDAAAEESRACVESA